jgi:hypothetical protein
MRSKFPGYFRPTAENFELLWKDCFFAFDANVLLNLYRYSPAARDGLLKALISVKNRAFIPHQVAKEFLRNRLSVTAGQAEEYTKAIKQIGDLVENLSNSKRHPFLPENELPKFKNQAEELCNHLDLQRSSLLERFSTDETLATLDSLFEHSTGNPFDAVAMKKIEDEGLLRYKSEIPPGYRDGKKNSEGDVYRKFGDFIVWKQLISKAQTEKKSFIFVTDDQKDDWWLEQSGRTIGPRPELIEEFSAETGCTFWMYSVEKFMQEIARFSEFEISPAVIQEVIEIREDAREKFEVDGVNEQLEDIEENAPQAAFMRALHISEALAEVVGPGPLPRTAIVSKLWNYIKKNNLQDPKNKKNINADEKLMKLFGKSQLSMFELASLIVQHVSAK